MQAGTVRSPQGGTVARLPLQQSNGLFAAQLVLPTCASYPDSLWGQEGSERGGEGPRKGLVPHNNNINNTNKNNWGAAFVRPIFLSFAHAFLPLLYQRTHQEFP